MNSKHHSPILFSVLPTILTKTRLCIVAGYTKSFFTYWYNSKNINEYLDLITKKSNILSHNFNVDFYNKYAKQGFSGVKRWVKEQIMDHDIIFFQINTGKHWILSIPYTNNKLIECHDSIHHNHLIKIDTIRQFLI